MVLYPDTALTQFEFDKVKTWLASYCNSDYARTKAQQLRIHTQLSYIQIELREAMEFKAILRAGMHFPNEFTKQIERELKLLSIPGAVLQPDDFIILKKLSENAAAIFRWFDAERRMAYPALADQLNLLYDEPEIRKRIDAVLDDSGMVKDKASPELEEIRFKLFRKRQELRRVFDKLAAKLNKLGYLADIGESFMNGRRVLAVFAEQKRMIKGIIHGESDSRKTYFLEPEETTSLNNDVYELENEESKEVYRILRELTASLRDYAPLLRLYRDMAGKFDLIRAKGLLAIELNAEAPKLHSNPVIKLVNAYHPLLYKYNKTAGKKSIPLHVNLNNENRILVISGPNAGGKTVALKTVGLLQVMFQAGLLIPAGADSELGIFKQLMIHMGDAQSIEFELSTYASHLKQMKYLLEQAHVKTLFFIDELGGGSDPNLGGAFAEVILEELARLHSFGIVTTHYLNLKLMAGKVKGIINGAMQFDEVNLLPRYLLQVGKPGSSYTFAIAERIGLDKKLIERAQKLSDKNQVLLDKLLNNTEQELRYINKEKEELQLLLKENAQLNVEMTRIMEKEKHKQELERLQLQNKMNAEKLVYIKEMERKLKALVLAWRKTDDKESIVVMIRDLLFKHQEKSQRESPKQHKPDVHLEIAGEIKVGDLVKMKQNRQVGTVIDIVRKKVRLQVGTIPITVNMDDLVLVKPIEAAEA